MLDGTEILKIQQEIRISISRLSDTALDNETDKISLMLKECVTELNKRTSRKQNQLIKRW